MFSAYGVRGPRKLQAQDRHGELDLVLRVGHGSVLHEVGNGNLHAFDIRAQREFDKVSREPVVSRGHRRVRRKNTFLTDRPFGVRLCRSFE